MLITEKQMYIMYRNTAMFESIQLEIGIMEIVCLGSMSANFNYQTKVSIAFAHK